MRVKWELVQETWHCLIGGLCAEGSYCSVALCEYVSLSFFGSVLCHKIKTPKQLCWNLALRSVLIIRFFFFFSLAAYNMLVKHITFLLIFFFCTYASLRCFLRHAICYFQLNFVKHCAVGWFVWNCAAYTGNVICIWEKRNKREFYFIPVDECLRPSTFFGLSRSSVAAYLHC